MRLDEVKMAGCNTTGIITVKYRLKHNVVSESALCFNSELGPVGNFGQKLGSKNSISICPLKEGQNEILFTIYQTVDGK